MVLASPDIYWGTLAILTAIPRSLASQLPADQAAPAPRPDAGRPLLASR